MASDGKSAGIISTKAIFGSKYKDLSDLDKILSRNPYVTMMKKYY